MYTRVSTSIRRAEIDIPASGCKSYSDRKQSWSTVQINNQIKFSRLSWIQTSRQRIWLRPNILYTLLSLHQYSNKFYVPQTNNCVLKRDDNEKSGSFWQAVDRQFSSKENPKDNGKCHERKSVAITQFLMQWNFIKRSLIFHQLSFLFVSQLQFRMLLDATNPAQSHFPTRIFISCTKNKSFVDYGGYTFSERNCVRSVVHQSRTYDTKWSEQAPADEATDRETAGISYFLS